ncbi:hypothetical protein GN244_ATG06476 [Phytophthora infestans]|uniref:Uncharacterized protein n=1 Tax=Phytophthora infestans TaxID=4787 RepID=A0A833W3T7_PHYIN|nr:hypothetical protein GN244_ATG06476 [Phytophthora infestans]KAF4149705.1 hypothetical protein GN958_ATG01101 [Phytophthora infestans]
MVAQQSAAASDRDGGSTVHEALTMEEKLRRWKQAKEGKQKITLHRRNSAAVIKENDLSETGTAKRKLTDRRRTTTEKAPDMLCLRFPATRKPRYSASIRHAPSTSRPMPRILATKRAVTPKSAHKDLGSAESPIIIEEIPELSLDRSDKRAHSQQVSKANTALETKNHVEPNQNLSTPVITEKKTLGRLTTDPNRTNGSRGVLCSSPKILQMSKEDEDVRTPLNNNPLKQRFELVTPLLNLATRDIPPATIQPVIEPAPAATPQYWNVNPALDKENQAEALVPINIPTFTVEKRPELLAKVLIKAAIGFQNQQRMATALSIFKRAYHVLPKMSSKLVERLMQLEREHPAAADQVPSQEMSTAAYMIKVLEHDLLTVLNHGTIRELTELHAIGAKRAESVLEKRPYHQLQELRRVPSISVNVIAGLYQHHTSWENHLW